ncbi:MAG: hypothetical protein J7513_16280, partial [Solirubrobacteraceae bacterium]|nr:hypothetical protein [Solirubrobacteraceae bacterium]
MHASALVTTLTAAIASVATFGTSLAQGAVTYRSKTCGQAASGSITLATPAGTASGDVMVASVAYAGVSGSTSAPSGWTQVPNLKASFGANQELITYYRVLSAAPAANYTFTGGSGADVASASLASFRGVDTTSPIDGTPAQTIVSSLATSGNFPNSTGVAAGSMRYSAIGIDDGSTTTMGSGLTTLCVEDNESGSDASIGTAYESTGVGTTATRGFTLDDNGHLGLQTFILAPMPCAQGGLNLTAPSTVSFGSHTLTGSNG